VAPLLLAPILVCMGMGYGVVVILKPKPKPVIELKEK
jgi:hypothetical protein